MFEVGWTEMLVIAIVMIVVVGPKDLPNMLRTFGRMAAKMRSMANDFRKQFDEALKEAELEDVKKSVDSLRGLNPMTEVRKQLNPFEQAAADVRAGVDQAMKPKPAPEPTVESADAPATPAEPLKNGATDMPGVSGPQAMPAAPVFPAMTDASVAVGTAASAAPARKARAPKAKPAGAASAAPAKAAAAKAPAARPPQPAAATPAGKANGAAPRAETKAATAKAPAKPAARPAPAKAAAKAAPTAKPAAAGKTARAK